MLKAFKDNPILIHQMRNAKWPSLRTAVRIAAALTVIGLALTISAVAIKPDPFLFAVTLAIYYILPVLGILSPLITAVTAIGATTQALDLEKKEEINLSQLSDRDKVNSCIARVIFQLRALWMAAGGLSLPFAVALAYVNAFFTNWVECLEFSTQPGRVCPPLSPPEIVTEYGKDALVFTLISAILFIAWNWLAANLGVWAAFRYRHLGKGLSAVLLFLVCIIALSVISILSMADGPAAAIIGSVVISCLLGWAAYRRAVKSV